MNILIEKLEDLRDSYYDDYERTENTGYRDWAWTVAECIGIVKKYSNDWISVEERFPNEDGFYLCTVLTGAVDKIKSVKIVGFENRATGGYFRVGDWQMVTHWQWLPELPNI